MKSAPLEDCWTGSAGGGMVSAAMLGSGAALLAVTGVGIWAAAGAVAPNAAPAAVAPFRKPRRPMASPRLRFDMEIPAFPKPWRAAGARPACRNKIQTMQAQL